MLISRRFLAESCVILCIFLASMLFKYAHLDAMVVDKPFRSDAAQYVQTAFNIVKHGRYGHHISEDGLEVDRLPGYPLVLASILEFRSENVRTFYKDALFFNITIGSFSVVLLYLLARSRFSVGVSIGISALLVLNPHVLAMEGYLLSESLFLFEMMLMALFFSKALSQKSPVLWLLVGILAGLSALTRPSFILFLPFSIVLILCFNKDSVTQVLKFSSLGFLVSMAPWGWYTYQEEIPLLGTKNNTVTLAAGFYPDFTYENPSYYGYPYRDPDAPDIHDDLGKALVQLRNWIEEDPIRYIQWFLVGKPISFWQWEAVQGAGDIYTYPVTRSAFREDRIFILLHAVYKSAYPYLLFFMLLGIVVGIIRRDDAVSFACAVIVLYFTALHIVFFSDPRYSVPLRPMMIYIIFYFFGFSYGSFQKYRRDRSDGDSGLVHSE